MCIPLMEVSCAEAGQHNIPSSIKHKMVLATKASLAKERRKNRDLPGSCRYQDERRGNAG
jgi:ribosomal protein L39E